jgi:hypothetical protein
MSQRLGNPQELVIPSGALGSNSGRSVSFNNSGWAIVACISIKYTATATVGTRTTVITLLDQNGNTTFIGSLSAAGITAGQTVQGSFGGGLPLTNINLAQTAPLPNRICIPPNSRFIFNDTANIDNADSFSAVVLLVF